MEPPKDAERIVGDVCSKLEIDGDRLREQVRERFVPGAYWHDLIEAERVASDVVGDASAISRTTASRRSPTCASVPRAGGARARDQNDLRAGGAESWIARAVIHHHAFQLAWDVLGEHGLLTDLGDGV